MTNKIEKQIEEMKKQTIGVEVEMNNITRRHASHVVAQYFGTIAYDANSEYGYYSYACKDRKGRVWKFQKDVSIAGPEDEKCELVTPILTYDDIEDLQEIIRILRKEGAKSDASRGCGVHIHIGANGHSPQTLRNLTNIMASHERLIIEALDIANERISRYCKTVDPRFLKEVNKLKPKSMKKIADVWYKSQNANFGRERHYNDSRYHFLNFHAVFTKGTVEFRCFEFKAPEGGKQNGLHAGQLKSYIQFCLALSQMAKEVKCASSKPQQKENPKYAMRTWLLRLGFIGDEFKTARDVLTKNLTGDASFRSGLRPEATASC